MPFDTALSGIRAASSELSITGNNIANASTTGFKSSRAEFGDVYATSVLGSGSNTIGSGVQVQAVTQRFTGGNIGFTENELDLAINGNGFFVVNREGETLFTRAGTFGLDNQGYIVNNSNARLQGYSADAQGNLNGIQGNIQLQTSNLAPRQTTTVESLLNLDSTEPVLQTVGNVFVTEGNAIGVARGGLQNATTTTLTSNQFNLPLGNNFVTTPMDFDLQLTGAASGNNGVVSISLDTAAGVPATISNFNDLRTLASIINSQIFSPNVPQTPIDVVANAVDLGGGAYRMEFSALQEGENSQISISNQTANVAQIGVNPSPASVAGIPAVSNGYPQQSIDIIDPDGGVVSYTSLAGATAAATAAELNSIQGVSATATTQLTLTGYNNPASMMTLKINGLNLNSDSLVGLESEINSLTNSTLPGITAELDASGGALVISSAVGDDIEIAIASLNDGDSVTVQGDPDAPAQVLEADAASNGVAAGNYDAATNSIVVGGTLEIVLEDGYTIDNANPPSTGIFQPIGPTEFESIVINEFDPTDQSTYNAATPVTVYDSLGNSHTMTQFFVKQNYNPDDATTSPNHWMMYVQIDGQNVGDPNTTLPPPLNTEPTMAGFNIHFNEDGSLNSALSDEILISNWVPRDSTGRPNGALGPLNVLAGGTTAISEPPMSSNFVVDLTGTTQFGDDFSVNDIDQDGYATGRLSGLTIEDDGMIFARFTNGESQVLGQIVLADFANQEGLQPVGDTMWAENFQSGPPNIGAPGSASLGAIQAGALEESNVDLSEQLVNLIIAQRNFQASAKTIETADQVTQTIINLR